ncbi:MAG: hypothetical protein RIR51_482 [Bacteroidota bacterium]
MNRSTFVKSAFGLVGLSFLAPQKIKAKFNSKQLNSVAGPFSLPALGYSFSALEPHIDAMTMEIHHDRHHNGYVNNLNNAVNGTALEKQSLEEILASVSNHSTAVRNNGGGHWNHSFFWKVIGPENSAKPSAKLASMIQKDFGSMEAMQEQFNKAAGTRFGSGWAWLVKTADGSLKICSTPNQDNPLMDIAEVKGTPILGIDVWEHAYYLHYQNKRADYIKAFWNLVNWDYVNTLV